jgi:hypothetical protein
VDSHVLKINCVFSHFSVLYIASVCIQALCFSYVMEKEHSVEIQIFLHGCYMLHIKGIKTITNLTKIGTVWL